jgi:Mg-chelatase subunit ChlD
MNTTTSIVPGSLQAIATANGGSLAESFVQCDHCVIVDTSGSMGTIDIEPLRTINEGRRRGASKTRYERACLELQTLQATLPGKIAVISFSSTVEFCPSGVPTNLGAGTDLAGALKFARVADDCDMSFTVISDGQPDDADDALAEAAKYTSKISTIFIGPAGGNGETFLKQLAAASGGQALQAHQAQDLAAKTQRLLLAGA